MVRSEGLSFAIEGAGAGGQRGTSCEEQEIQIPSAGPRPEVCEGEGA